MKNNSLCDNKTQD